MKMKKYNAPSIAEAMKLIRADLGDDAVILNSKVVVQKKFFGIVKKKSFEVVAGIDRVEKKPILQPLPDLQQPIFQPTPSLQPVQVIPPVPAEQATEKQHERMNNDIKKELEDLKSLLKSFQKQTLQSQDPDEFLPFMEHLRKQELSEELITNIGDGLFDYCNHGKDTLSEQQMREFTERFLRQQLEHLPFGGLSYTKRIVNILGPTGVGKTTTIAKMAARAVLESKKKIGFITTDTYRIAAIEQLKTYAGLLQSPVEVVYNEQDYKKAIENLQNVDLIFIDTAGRNYKEAKYVNDLVQLIDFNEQTESYLVLSLTAKQGDLESVIDQFTDVPIEKFVFTKMDETNSIGTIFNLMIKYNKGLAYYTNGQEVPEDIEIPTLEKLLELFFQGRS
ncbi:MAG: flagellar biosynthesis protein FlhF [Lysinibacillus sp.]